MEEEEEMWWCGDGGDAMQGKGTVQKPQLGGFWFWEVGQCISHRAIGPCVWPQASGRSADPKVHLNSGENDIFLPVNHMQRCK